MRSDVDDCCTARKSRHARIWIGGVHASGVGASSETLEAPSVARLGPGSWHSTLDEDLKTLLFAKAQTRRT